MRTFVLLLAALPACAQVGGRSTAAAAPAPAAAKPSPTAQPKTVRIPLSALVALERVFDAKVSGLASDNAGPVDVLGATRGVYLDGFGAIFTTEIGLIQTPTINPFNSTITDAQKNRVHSAKVTRLPGLRKLVSAALHDIAVGLPQVPETEQIVLAIRLDYSSWENTAGLPGLLIAKADRRSALAGNIQVQEQ
jgi:hypothetical protein